MALKRYVIERDIPSIGSASQADLSGAAGTSNAALAKLAPRVQWEHSYVTGDKTFCIYLAEDEAAIREHAELSSFPATVVTEVTAMIDPTTQDLTPAPWTGEAQAVRVGRPLAQARGGRRCHYRKRQAATDSDPTRARRSGSTAAS